jgi:hypothetical protein
MKASSKPCPRCGSVIPVEAPAGVCPRCALAAVAEPADSRGGRDPKPPTIEELIKAFPGLEFEGFLGAGGMGFVYRVKDRATGEIGALKVLLRELGISEGAVEVAVHRLRQRFREAVRSEIAQTLPAGADLEEELRYLIEVIAESCG